MSGINNSMNYSLYFHIPFCKHRCHYCDFNTNTGKELFIPAYMSALIKEIRIANLFKPGLPIHSVYFGGGTPSIIPFLQYKELLTVLKSEFVIADNCEISIEANPGTLSKRYLEGLRDLGFNRLSIGVQSTNSFDLTRLDRIHSLDDVLESVYFAKLIGFGNINLDLIFGLPWQDLAGWEQSLLRAISLAPEHFSLYSLIIEPGTPLFGWLQKGLIAPQDQDIEGDMYERAQMLLDQAGYEHYEISNWAKRDKKNDFRCRHNLQYWLNQPYLGFGAGAHGFVDGYRTVNTSSIKDYLERMNLKDVNDLFFPVTPATTLVNKIDSVTQMNDFMMLGLRLIEEGVSEERFEESYGSSMKETFREKIHLLVNKGLVEWIESDQQRLRLTQRGVMVANQVFMEFI